jgi:amphi-Trp domain-containing protein
MPRGEGDRGSIHTLRPNTEPFTPPRGEPVTAAIPAKFRARARRDAAAFYLSQLAKGLLAGEIVLMVGEQQLRQEECAMGDSREFEFEGAATPAEAADALNRIAEGIRARSLSLSMGEEEITVYPEGDLALEIEASEKKGKAKIEIAIAWKRVKDDDDDDEDD